MHPQFERHCDRSNEQSCRDKFKCLLDYLCYLIIRERFSFPLYVCMYFRRLTDVTHITDGEECVTARMLCYAKI